MQLKNDSELAITNETWQINASRYGFRLTNINKELIDLRNKFTKVESDLAFNKIPILSNLANRIWLRENVGQTKNMPETNVLKVRAFLLTFPRMIWRVSFFDIFCECDADIDTVNIKA